MNLWNKIHLRHQSEIKPLFGTVAQTVISRYNYGRERSQSRKYNITVFYQCINQKGPWVLQAICLVHLYWMVADIRRQHPIVLSKKIIIRMYRKRCKINQEISGNPKIRQGIYSGWILYVRELPMAVGNLGLQRQILSATHQLLYSNLTVKFTVQVRYLPSTSTTTVQYRYYDSQEYILYKYME